MDPLGIFNNLMKSFSAGAQDQAQRVVTSPLVQQGNAAAAQIKAPIAQTLQTVGAPILNPQVNARVANAMMNPVSTFGTPALKKIGVPSGIATGVGVVGDILASPGGAEKKAAEYAPSVLQIAHANGTQSFYRIPQALFDTFKKLVDSGQTGIAGIPTKIGDVFHITAKTPEQMIARGFIDRGVATPSIIPQQVVAHTRAGAPVNSYLRTPAVAPELQPLAKEAQKYKTAEEFVKAQGGTAREDLGSVIAERVYKDTNTIPSQDIPKFLQGEVKVFQADPNKVAKLFGANRVTSDAAVNRYAKEMKAGADFPPVYIADGKFVDGGNRVMAAIKAGVPIKVADITNILNDAIKFGKEEGYNFVQSDKSQLTDIWNKANAGSKVDPLITEARKYKSAENLSVQQKGMQELSLKVAKEHGVAITADGNLVLYHGTKEGRAPKVGDDWRVGSYFTSDPKVARQFAGQGDGGAIKIMKVEVPPHTVFPSGDGTYYTLNEKIPVRAKQ